MNWIYEEGRIFYENESGELMAEATYHVTESGEVDVDHTYVNPVLRGQGVASVMMGVVAEHLRTMKIKAIASCSYAQVWFKKHADQYQDVVSDQLGNAAAACRVDGRH